MRIDSLFVADEEGLGLRVVDVLVLYLGRSGFEVVTHQV